MSYELYVWRAILLTVFRWAFHGIVRDREHHAGFEHERCKKVEKTNKHDGRVSKKP